MNYSNIKSGQVFIFNGCETEYRKNDGFSYSDWQTGNTFRLAKGINPECSVLTNHPATQRIYNEVNAIIPQRQKSVRGRCVD